MWVDDTTTIQIKKSTKKFLDSLKGAYKVTTYDEVVNQLVLRKTKSMHGAGLRDGEAPPSIKEILKGLRDKHDRV